MRAFMCIFAYIYIYIYSVSDYVNACVIVCIDGVCFFAPTCLMHAWISVLACTGKTNIAQYFNNNVTPLKRTAPDCISCAVDQH